MAAGFPSATICCRCAARAESETTEVRTQHPMFGVSNDYITLTQMFWTLYPLMLRCPKGLPQLAGDRLRIRPLSNARMCYM